MLSSCPLTSESECVWTSQTVSAGAGALWVQNTLHFRYFSCGATRGNSCFGHSRIMEVLACWKSFCLSSSPSLSTHSPLLSLHHSFVSPSDLFKKNLIPILRLFLFGPVSTHLPLSFPSIKFSLSFFFQDFVPMFSYIHNSFSILASLTLRTAALLSQPSEQSF